MKNGFADLPRESLASRLADILCASGANETIYETLKAIRFEIGAVREDVSDVKADIRGVKSHMAGFMQSEVARDGAIASVQSRLDRIERRLDLTN